MLADGIDGAGKRSPKSRKVRAAVNRVDIVGEAENGLRVAVVVLQGDLDLDVIARGLHHDGLVVQHGLAAVEMLHELRNAAGIFEFCPARFARLGIRGALIGERDFQALVQEGHLAQSLRQRVVVELGDCEDALVRQEVHLGPAPLAGACLAQIARRRAATEVHLPCVAVAPDLDIELLRESIHATHAHTVQPA